MSISLFDRTWSAFVYYTVSLLALLFISWAIYYFGETNLPPLLTSVRWVINLLYLNLAFAYALLIRNAQFSGALFKIGVVLIIVIPILSLMHPVFSGDLREYLIRGRILGLYHKNPYHYFPKDIPNDFLYPYSTFLDRPDAQGPLAIFIQTIPALLFQKSLVGMIWFYKLLLGIFVGIAVFAFSKILEAKATQGEPHTLVMFTLNPLLLVSTFIDGHSDVMMVALSVGAVFFLIRRSWMLCFLFWTLAFLIKYMVIIILPFFILIAVREKMREEKVFPWLFIFKQLGINVAIIVAFFWPLWVGWDPFLPTLRVGASWFYNNTIPYVVYQLLTFLGIEGSQIAIHRGFLLGYFLLYIFLLRKAWLWDGEDTVKLARLLCLAYIGFNLSQISPIASWYLLWALPWLVLSRWPLHHWVVMLYSFVGLFSYFKRINYLMILAVFVYLGVWLFVRKFFFHPPSLRPYGGYRSIT